MFGDCDCVGDCFGVGLFVGVDFNVVDVGVVCVG